MMNDKVSKDKYIDRRVDWENFNYDKINNIKKLA